MTQGGVQPPATGERPNAWLRGVRARLLALVAAATIPVAVIAGNNAWTSYRNTVAQGERDAMILREVAAARHGAAVEALKEMLTGLAAHGGLLDLAPDACDSNLARLRSLTPERYSNFWVIDPEGKLLCSGLPARRGESYAHVDYVQAAIASHAFTIGDFRLGLVSNRAVMPALAPIRTADGMVAGYVGGGLFLDFFLRTDADSNLVRPHQVWLLDSDGSTLPLGGSNANALPPIDSLLSLIAGRETTIRGDGRDGVRRAWSIRELEPGLHLLVGLPVGETMEAARVVLQERLMELVLFLLACLAAILIGVELGVSRPLRRLAERVRNWTPGRPYAGQPGGNVPVEVRELDQALTTAAAALQDREDALTAALKQRDLLMAEIHHRVKNNLQIVASLLSLQAGRVRSDAARKEFAVARDRVQALATLHRYLYMNQSFERLSLRPFLEELSRQLGEAFGSAAHDRIEIRIQAGDIELSTDQAISLSLLLTEAVSNSMRHAFPDGRRGVITILLQAEGDNALLEIADNGVGFDPEDGGGDGLGTQLIEGFAHHLGGTVSFRGEAGSTSVSVRFPLGDDAGATAAPLRGAA